MNYAANFALGYNKETILGFTSWADLFPLADTSAIYVKKKLLGKWHPDKGGDTDVSTHIIKLWEERAAVNYPFLDSMEVVPLTGDKMCSLVLLGKNYVDFVFQEGVNGFGFKDSLLLSKMSGTFSRIVLPVSFDAKKRAICMFDLGAHLVEQSVDIKYPGIYWYKTKVDGDYCRLTDAIPYFRPRDVCWLISRLLHTLCSLNFSKINHFGITPDNIYVDVSQHRALLLGGWWFSSLHGEVPGGMSAIAYKYYTGKPADSDSVIGLRCVKDIARIILGSDLLDPKKVPVEMANWIQNSVITSVLSEYKSWDKVLETAWGGKKWIDFPVNKARIYSNRLCINKS